MRKIFLLIPALLLALVVNADEINISSGTSNIIHYTIADSNTKDGDVIVLTDAGPYISTAGVDDYTKLVKNLTIKAADGINPVIKLEVPFRSTGGKSVKFIGITFDGTSLSSSYDFYFRFYDNADNLEFEDCEFKNISKYIFDVYTDKSANSLVIKNCNFHDVSSRGILNRGTIGEINISGSTFSSFTDYPIIHNYSNGSIGKIKIDGSEFYSNAKYLINGEATSHADSCIITNCYFHNNSRSAVYFAASTVDGVETCDGVIVKNSTFANNDMSASDGSVIEVRNYNAAVASNIEVTVDHCTFYNNPTSASGYAAIRSYKSTKVNVSNCIFAHPTSYDRCGTYCYGGNVTNCLAYNLTSGTNGHHSGPTLTGNFTADPLFADAANGDFSLAGNWVTMNLSPARGAATDGSDLGDPRWYSAETLPSTDFASPYVLTGDKAKLTGNVATDASNYLQFSNSSDATQHGVAIWKVHATRSCYLQATLNIDADNTSGHRYQIEVFDSSNTLIGTAIGESANSWEKGDQVISDLIILPEAGDYKIKLSNLCNNSSNLLHSITLSYAGGAVVNVPGTLNISDAVITNGKREDGVIKFPDATTGVAEWNIAVASAAALDIALTIKNQYGHNLTVSVYEEDGVTLVDQVGEGGNKYTSNEEGLAIELGSIYLAAGNYVLKVTNATSGSDAKIASLTLSYIGGAIQNMPGTTNINDAWFSSNGTRTGGAIEYTNIGDGCWAKWNIAVATAATYNVTVNIKGQYGHDYTVEFLKEGETTPIVVTKGAINYTNDLTLYANELGTVELEAANYEITVSNAVGDASLISVTLTYVGGAVIVLPATLNANDASFSASAYADAGEIHFVADPTSHNVLGEWAKWKVRVTADGTFLFTMDVNSDNGQGYRISIMDDGDNLIDFCDLKASSGVAATLKHYFNLSAGDYYVKIENTKTWSHGYVTGLVVTQPSLLNISEMAENNTVIVDNYRLDAQDIQITRTIVAGMYNTICLPFDVSSTQLIEVFGDDVELLSMASATLEGEVLNLNFDNATSSGIYRGTPYLIKTSKNIVNPVFTDAIIKEKVGQASDGTNADFIGTFIKTTIPASPNNLFVGTGNKLYFAEDNTPIKGMRAWFQVDVPGSALPVVRPRIVLNGQVITEVELVNGEPQVNGKFIENGQLIIVKDGIRYNALGVRIK